MCGLRSLAASCASRRNRPWNSRIISQVGSEPLQRDQALVIIVEGTEHLAHATAAEERL